MKNSFDVTDDHSLEKSGGVILVCFEEWTKVTFHPFCWDLNQDGLAAAWIGPNLGSFQAELWFSCLEVPGDRESETYSVFTL